jgi:hypothetical protein
MSDVFKFSSGTWRPDHALFKRIRNAYRIAVRHYEQPEGTMWATLNEKRQEIHAALMADDDETTIEMLSRPDRNELFYGIDTLSKISVDGLQTPAVQTQIEDTIVNHLSATAETIGAIDVYNPEAGKPRPDFDAEVILSAIDAVLGCKVQCPANFANEFGLVTSRGLVTYKVPISIYHAHRIMQISRLVGGRRVLEIGPGIGRVAFYVRSMGFTDYTTVDLPLGIVGQAIFLSAVMGPDAIWMAGDDHNLQKGRIRLLPPHLFNSLNENFDIVLNVDSIPEMPHHQAVAYFDFAKNHSKAFISTNHEVHPLQMKDLPSALGMDMPTIRSLSTIRPGYVDELFIFVPHKSRGALSRFCRLITKPTRSVCDLLPGMFRFPYPLRSGYVEGWFLKSKIFRQA